MGNMSYRNDLLSPIQLADDAHLVSTVHYSYRAWLESQKLYYLYLGNLNNFSRKVFSYINGFYRRPRNLKKAPLLSLSSLLTE